jgi:hypothetical protein
LRTRAAELARPPQGTKQVSGASAETRFFLGNQRNQEDRQPAPVYFTTPLFLGYQE